MRKLCSLSVRSGLLLASVVLVSACGDDPDPAPTGVFDATVAPAASDAGVDAAGCSAAQTQPCVCTNGTAGTRSCSAGRFSDTCENCGPATVVDTTTKCVAGRYVGLLDIPYYAPGPAGICGLVTLFGGGGKGPLAFTLGASDNAEFASVIGSSSCLDVRVEAEAGVAVGDFDASGIEVLDGGGTARSLSMELSGSVNCATGEFKGEVKGTYRSVSFCDFGMMENDYFMKGPVTAKFDPVTRSFKNGVLDLREPKVLFALGGEAGGSGTWEAKLDTDAGTPPPPANGCLHGVTFRDDMFK